MCIDTGTAAPDGHRSYYQFTAEAWCGACKHWKKTLVQKMPMLLWGIRSAT